MHTPKKFIIFGEGECTEPEYFERIKVNRNDLGLSSLVSFKQIPRLEMDRNETDIDNMVKIALDYVAYCMEDTLSRRLFVSLTFETAYRRCVDENIHLDIIGDNRSLLDLRKRINKELDDVEIDEDITRENMDKAEKICRNVFSEVFKKRISEYLPLFPLKKIQIMPGDEICIIHDRDYSERWFSDKKYDNVVKRVSKLGDSPRYRLIITYPKFELWMLLHSTDFNVNSIDMRRLTDYSRKEPSSHNGYDEKPGPSVYVDKLMDEYAPDSIWQPPSKKRINPCNFDKVLIKGFSKALEDSNNPRFTRDIKLLRNKPGTMLGVLFEEIIADKGESNHD